MRSIEIENSIKNSSVFVETNISLSEKKKSNLTKKVYDFEITDS